PGRLRSREVSGRCAPSQTGGSGILPGLSLRARGYRARADLDGSIESISVSFRVVRNDSRIEPETAIHEQVIAAREGRDPRVVARLFSGWAVFGEQQFLRGYALLLPDPVVPSLNALGAKERSQFLLDMARLGDALLKVTGAIRINYAIFG